jgi:hypothetical protein
MWVRFTTGAVVVVVIAASTAVVALSKGGDDLPGPGVLNANADDTAYSASLEHIHTSRVSLIDWVHPPRSANRFLSVRAVTEGYCVGTERKPAGEGADVKESPRAVVVGPAMIHEFAPVPGSWGCAGIGYDAPVRVALRHPLGDRAIMTSATRPRHGRTLWPSEGQFQCLRQLGGARADKRLFGARSRDEIATEKQVAGVLQIVDRWGRGCGVQR